MTAIDERLGRGEAARTRPAPLTLSATVLATVVCVTAIAPLATDMYVPAFPLVGRDLDSSATQVQLTLTTFFVGMALGQLLGGPFSDRTGRRRPLLAALVVLAISSMLCAFTPLTATSLLALGLARSRAS